LCRSILPGHPCPEGPLGGLACIVRSRSARSSALLAGVAVPAQLREDDRRTGIQHSNPGQCVSAATTGQQATGRLWAIPKLSAVSRMPAKRKVSRDTVRLPRSLHISTIPSLFDDSAPSRPNPVTRSSVYGHGLAGQERSLAERKENPPSLFLQVTSDAREATQRTRGTTPTTLSGERP